MKPIIDAPAEALDAEARKLEDREGSAEGSEPGTAEPPTAEAEPPPPAKATRTTAWRSLLIGAQHAEAEVTWEEVAVTLADAKMLAFGARLAELRAKAMDLGLVRPKRLSNRPEDEGGPLSEPPRRRPLAPPLARTTPTEADRNDAREELRRIGYRTRARGSR